MKGALGDERPPRRSRCSRSAAVSIPGFIASSAEAACWQGEIEAGAFEAGDAFQRAGEGAGGGRLRAWGIEGRLDRAPSMELPSSALLAAARSAGTSKSRAIGTSALERRGIPPGLVLPARLTIGYRLGLPHAWTRAHRIDPGLARWRPARGEGYAPFDGRTAPLRAARRIAVGLAWRDHRRARAWARDLDCHGLASCERRRGGPGLHQHAGTLTRCGRDLLDPCLAHRRRRPTTRSISRVPRQETG